MNSRYYDPQVKRFLNADDLGYLGANGDLQAFNLYAYCSNNPVMNVDFTGCYPLQAAFELLFTWLTGDGSVQNYSSSSRIVKKLKKSKKMQKIINNELENHKNGKEVLSGTSEFTPEDGYELYLSTQHFDYTITVTEQTRTRGFWFWKREQKRYVANVVVHDTYNFDSYRDWNSFGNIMNNIAYAYSHIGGADFEWYATYTYSTKWNNIY